MMISSAGHGRGGGQPARRDNSGVRRHDTPPPPPATDLTRSEPLASPGSREEQEEGEALGRGAGLRGGQHNRTNAFCDLIVTVF